MIVGKGSSGREAKTTFKIVMQKLNQILLITLLFDFFRATGTCI